MGCKLCEVEIEHAAEECDRMKRWEGEVGVLMGKRGEGYSWIKEWLDRKKKVEPRNLKEND